MELLPIFTFCVLIALSTALNCYTGSEIYTNGMKSSGSFYEAPCTSVLGTIPYCTRSVTGSSTLYTINKACSLQGCSATTCSVSNQYQANCCCNDRELCNASTRETSLLTVTTLGALFLFAAHHFGFPA